MKASEGDVVEMEFQRTLELAREASWYTLDLEVRRRVLLRSRDREGSGTSA